MIENSKTDADEVKNMHWSEILAKKIAAERKPPFVVAAGITPSGPVHPGTLCEFLFAQAVAKELGPHGKVHYVFISDDMDALDSVPEPLKEYAATINEDMGMPLCLARDPKGCHASFAEHFIAETQNIMKIFGVKVEFLRASELYAAGKYDEYAKLLCERKDEVKEVVRASSNRDVMPADWFPIMPLCEKCKNVEKVDAASGKKRGNTVLEYKDGAYKYRCSKCGYEGNDTIAAHHYKLLFRLDWATRQKFLNVVVEGGSVDHHSPGGTLSTVIAIRRKIYNEEPPFLYKFGLLKYKGKKYSKSKGIGHTVNELLTLAPVAVIKYVLLRPDVQEDKELVIDKDTLFVLLDDFKKASQLAKSSESMSRPDRKKAIAFELCDAGAVWTADPSDLVLYYNIYGDWKKAGELAGDAAGVKMLEPYLKVWLEKQLVPDKYMFKLAYNKAAVTPLVEKYLAALKPGMSAEDIHNLAFTVAQESGAQGKDVFKQMYNWLIAADMGPRLGKLIFAIGVEKVKAAGE
ncbi:MAG: lysine--tRNA ligase [Candidatus Micrarchaeota archaeon]